MSTPIRAKRVSNYELFFDLAVVLAIGKLTSAFHIEHIGWLEVWSFILGNIILLSVWMNEVFYYNKYGDSRRADIYTVVTLMFVLGNMALNFNFDSSLLSQRATNDFRFNLLLIIAYAIIGLQYFLKGRKLGFSKDIKTAIAHNLISAAAIFPLIIPFVHNHFELGLLYLIPLILPFFLGRHLDTERDNFPHFLERAQLVTILTFGEAVIAIISTYPLAENLYQGALLFFGMAMLFMFYMTQTFLAINHHTRKNASLLFYVHILIFIGINFFTVGLEFLADHHHAPTGFKLFVTGVLMVYIGTLLTTYYNQKLYQFTIREYLAFTGLLAAILCAFMIAGPHILPLSIILIIGGWCFSRYYMFTRRRSREQNNVPHPDPTKNLRDFS